MMWPFRNETRGAADATEARISAIEAEAHSPASDPEALGVAEACAGLWERSLAAATVAPASLALSPVSAAILALAGRGLARRGEAVFLIDTSEAGIRLVPAAGWDVRGGADPETWRYRVDLIGPSVTTTQNVAGQAVLHFRVGCDPRTPWRGKGPLKRGESTAKLAAKIETSATVEASMPIGRFLSIPLNPDQAQAQEKQLARTGAFVVTGVGQGTVTQDAPNSRFSPVAYGPKPDQVLEALRTRAGQDVAAAYGVPPVLLASTGDGAGQREAWRRFWAATIAPLGSLIEAELQDKLDPAASVQFEALRASDEDGRSRAVSRRAAAFKTFTDAGLERAEAARLAGLDLEAA